ncbi:hypothetical protein QBC42DRAFT_279400, partial [Cladorrhinum samala]
FFFFFFFFRHKSNRIVLNLVILCCHITPYLSPPSKKSTECLFGQIIIIIIIYFLLLLFVIFPKYIFSSSHFCIVLFNSSNFEHNRLSCFSHERTQKIGNVLAIRKSKKPSSVYMGHNFSLMCSSFPL